MDPNDTILFLDCAEDKMIFRRLLPAPSPLDCVIAQPATKISLVHFIKKRAQIKVFAFLTKI